MKCNSLIPRPCCSNIYNAFVYKPVHLHRLAFIYSSEFFSILHEKFINLSPVDFMKINVGDTFSLAGGVGVVLMEAIRNFIRTSLGNERVSGRSVLSMATVT